MLQINNNRKEKPPVVLTIAGSDSGGGAGIQADLKTFMALGTHGLSAIAALTAQNTRGVAAIHRPPRTFLRAQLDALFDDFPIAAVKIGMLGSVATVETVAATLSAYAATPIVLDPVMVATSGARLSDRRAIAALTSLLLPLADILTPNLPEAEALTGRTISDVDSQIAAAQALLDQVRGGVLLKGGHLPGRELADIFVERQAQPSIWRHARLDIDAHGTGCTLASAITAFLGHRLSHREAVNQSIAFLQTSLAAAYRPGKGDAYVPNQSAAMRHPRA